MLLCSVGLCAGTADRRVLLLGVSSLWVSLGACAVGVPIGAFLALMLCRTNVPGRRFMFWLIASMLFLPLYLHAAAWDAGFGQLGWYSVARESIRSPWLRGAGAVMWIHGLWSVPWVLLIVSAALQWSEPELEEAALLDATPGRVFARVTLRRAWPGVAAASVWVLLATTGEIVVTDLYQVRTLAEELYTGYALGEDSTTAASLFAAGLVTGALTGLAMMTLDRALVFTQRMSGRRPVVFRLGWWRWPALLLVLLVLGVLVWVPLGNLVYQMGLEVRQVAGVPVRGWSLGRCLELLVPWQSTYRFAAIWEFRQPLGWTLVIGASAASLALAIALPLAWLGRRGGLRALPAVALASAGLGTMGPLVGIVLLRLFSLPGATWLIWLRDQTILVPVLAVTWRCLPMTLAICWMALSGLSPSLLDAARVDGAGSLTRFLRIGVRLRVAALAVAWLVSLAIGCGELPASILVVPAGVTTVPIRVFGLMHAGVANQAAAICVTSVAGFLLFAVVIGMLRQGDGRLWDIRSR